MTSYILRVREDRCVCIRLGLNITSSSLLVTSLLLTKQQSIGTQIQISICVRPTALYTTIVGTNIYVLILKYAIAKQVYYIPLL